MNNDTWYILNKSTNRFVLSTGKIGKTLHGTDSAWIKIDTDKQQCEVVTNKEYQYIRNVWEAKRIARAYQTSHFIAMTGMGNGNDIPLFCCTCDDLESAVETIAQVYDLNRRQMAYLRLNWSIVADGELSEITSCDCDDPDQHNDN